MNGHIHKYRDRWRYVIEGQRTHDGQRQRITKAGFKTRREAKAALDDHLAELHAGVRRSDQTFGEYLEGFLAEEKLARAETTWSLYRVMVRAYITPHVGGIRLADVTEGDLARLYATLAERLAPKTVRNVHGLTHKALKQAHERRLIPRNPAATVEKPQKPRGAPRAWTADQLRRFLAASRNERVWPAYYLLASTGMRRGEALGLRWQDLDLDGGHLRIVQTLVMVGSRAEIRRDTKTAKSRRRVALDPGTVNVLREWRRHQLEERMAWGEGWQDTGLVFTREDGTPLRPSWFTTRFQQLATAAGVPPVGVHGLRHTWASLALVAGVNPKVVADRLGHSSVKTALDLYSHVIDSLDEAAADVVGAVISGG